MPFKFEELKVWKASLDLGEKINLIAESFPKKEMYNLGANQEGC